MTRPSLDEDSALSQLSRLAWFCVLAVVVAICTWMSGCAQFENRVVCTVNGDKGFVVSQYMRVGVASTLATADVEKICGGGK